MNPRMLQLLRESRGLSQSKLAKLANVPQPTISKLENGLTDMDADRAAAIAKALEYPLEAFDWTEEIFGFGSSAFHHRKQQSLGPTAHTQIHANVNLIRIRANRLLKGVEVETRFKFPSWDVEDLGSPQEIARAVRAAWMLPMGPVDSMFRCLENAGGVVVRADLKSPKISAISTSAPGSPPLFVLNTGMPADRERFTLAHELGHLVMHDLPGNVDDAEREADAFASEFLMPAAEIRAQLRGIDLAKAATLKRHWRTAMSALIRRARDLGQIDDGRYTSLNVQISQKGWRKVEPYPFEQEQPTVLPEIIRLHHEVHGYTHDDLAKTAGLLAQEYAETFDDHPKAKTARGTLRAL